MTRSSTSIAFTIALLAGCSTGPEPLSYEEFEARAYREPDTGLRVIDGDQLVETEAAMRARYAAYLDAVAAAADRAAGLGTAAQGLAVNQVNGADDKWPAAAAANLTYCVSSATFGSQYTTTVSALAAATADWEAATGGAVDFVHLSAHDGNCTHRNSGVVFNVRLVSTSQYLARAFYPSASRKARELLVASSAFGSIYPWTFGGLLRHELGHALGFRHEHTRPEAGACFEDASWRALTMYDAASVMHYPECNGAHAGAPALTELDRAGAAALY